MWRRRLNRRASSQQTVRLGLESLEARVLLAADEPWENLAATPANPPAEVVSLVPQEAAFAEQAGVWLESDGAPAPPPNKTLGDPPQVSGPVVVVERPFLTGVLKITQYSTYSQRFQIDAPRKGSSSVLFPYVQSISIYGYEDHGDFVVIYPEPEVRGRPRSSVEYHFDGVQQTVRYSGMSQKFVQELQHVASKTGALSSKGIFTEAYEITTEEVRLFQRTDEVYDQNGGKIDTHVSHYARNGDTVELDIGSPEGGTAELRLGAEHYEFAFSGRVEVDPLYYDVNLYSLQGVRGKLVSQSPRGELAKISFDPQSIRFQVVAEETVLATQAFGNGIVEVVDHRTVAFGRAEKLARIVVPNPRNGKPLELLLLEKLSGFEVDAQGALVVRNVESARKISYAFSSPGSFERTEARGDTQKTDTRELSSDGQSAWLQLTRERWAGEEKGVMTLLQDRVLSRDAQGDLSQETYLRYAGGEQRLIWSRPLYDPAAPVWLTYLSQDRADTVELVSLTDLQFDGFGRLESLEGVQRYEPGLLQRMIEFHVEETGLQVDFRLVPRPMYLRREFGDGQLLIEQRPNYDRFVYLVDSQGNVLFERKLESFSINDEYVLVEYDHEVSFIRPDGTLAAVTLVPFGDSRIEVRDTLGLERTDGGSRLETLERTWRLEDRELQKETYQYAADGSLLAVRLKRNPLEWLAEDESPLAAFTLDTRTTERAATMFLSYTRTGELRDLGVRQLVFPVSPDLVRDAAGLVQTIRGAELAPDGTSRFWQLEFAAEGTRLNERVLFEARFGTASDERLGRIAVIERFDQQGPARLLVRFSGQPLVANRAAWHPFDLFFAAQPLVEYEISDWTSTGDRLTVTRLDGSLVTMWADETSIVMQSERTSESPWGLLTTRTWVRPTYNFGDGAGLLLLPFRQEIVAVDGRVWQSERTNFQMPLLGGPAVSSQSLVWRLADGRTVEYRQQAESHLLTATAADGSMKRYRLLSSPQLDRWAETGLVTQISGQIAGPDGLQEISLELVG